MGQSRWIDDDQIRRKRTPSFPSHESNVSRNAEKQRRWKIIFTFLCRWGYGFNCFSHNYFCQSAHHLWWSVRLVWGIQYLLKSDPLLEPANSLMMTPRFSFKIVAKENIFQKCKEREERFPPISIDQNLYWCRIPENSWSRTILHDKAHCWVLTIFRASEMSWVYFTKMKNQLTRKVGFEWTPKLEPCWKSRTSYLQGKYEWKLELKLWTKTFLTRWSEFLMDWTSWSQTWSTKSAGTTSREPLERMRKYLRLQADPRLVQNQEYFPLLTHLQGPYIFLKEHGLRLE